MALPLRPVPKPSFPRNSIKAGKKGEISTKVRRELRERSGGICEKCHYALASQAAHLERRWRLKGLTTVKDLAHLCIECHTECDNTAAGRVWLADFKQQMEEEKSGY